VSVFVSLSTSSISSMKKARSSSSFSWAVTIYVVPPKTLLQTQQFSSKKLHGDGGNLAATSARRRPDIDDDVLGEVHGWNGGGDERRARVQVIGVSGKEQGMRRSVVGSLQGGGAHAGQRSKMEMRLRTSTTSRTSWRRCRAAQGGLAETCAHARRDGPR
jgi:hypothetical protein